jgi:hypothetical protein
MKEATTNLSATEITQLTGLIVGEGFKRMANKTETVKRFVNVLEANATGDILQIAKEILGEADFNHASKRLASFLSVNKLAKTKEDETKPIEKERKEKMTQDQTQAKSGRSRGRPSAFTGRRLTATMDHNPRKENTFGHRSYQILLENPGITFEEFRDLGGRANDLQYDYVRDRVEVSEVEEASEGDEDSEGDEE